MELREEYQPITEVVEKLPQARECYDLQLFVKDVDGVKELYIMVKGKMYLINSLTEV